jgi:chorismate mutase
MVLEGEQYNLSEEFILKLFKAVHQESINHQEKILNN